MSSSGVLRALRLDQKTRKDIAAEIYRVFLPYLSELKIRFSRRNIAIFVRPSKNVIFDWKNPIEMTMDDRGYYTERETEGEH